MKIEPVNTRKREIVEKNWSTIYRCTNTSTTILEQPELYNPLLELAWLSNSILKFDTTAHDTLQIIYAYGDCKLQNKA